MNSNLAYHRYDFGANGDENACAFMASVEELTETLVNSASVNTAYHTIAGFVRAHFESSLYALVPSGALLSAFQQKMAFEKEMSDEGISSATDQYEHAVTFVQAKLGTNVLRHVMVKLLTQAFKDSEMRLTLNASKILRPDYAMHVEDDEEESALESMLTAYVEQMGPRLLQSLLEDVGAFSPDDICRSTMNEWLEENEYIGMSDLNGFFNLRNGKPLQDYVDPDIICEAARSCDMISLDEIPKYAEQFDLIDKNDSAEYVIEHHDPSIFDDRKIISYAESELDMVKREDIIKEVQDMDPSDVFDENTLKEWALANGFIPE